MFDIGASELLLIVVVAVIVVGPKDIPLAMRTAGRWIGKMRKVSGHVRAGIDAMVREAELEDLEKEWQQRNRAIIAAHPAGEDPDSARPEEKANAPATAPEGGATRELPHFEPDSADQPPPGPASAPVEGRGRAPDGAPSNPTRS